MSEREGEATRRDVLSEIRRLSDKYPSLRICQLIGNAVPSEVMERRNNDLYYLEDSELLGYLQDYDRKVEEANRPPPGMPG